MENKEIAEVAKAIINTTDELEETIRKLSQDLREISVSAKIAENFDNFFARYIDYSKKLESKPTLNQIIKSASLVQVYGSAIVSNIKRSNIEKNEDILKTCEAAQDLALKLKNIIEEREVTLGENNTSEVIESYAKNISKSEITKELKEQFNSFKLELEKAEERHLKKETILTVKLAEIEQKISTLESEIEEKIEAVDQLYSNTKENLEEKQSSIDNLLGTISEGAIARGYDTSAAAEKRMADWLRIGSLGCMLVVVTVIALSLYETTTDYFKIENSIFRLIFTILLSVPAAYLARESTKHRQQQYTHLQTSLDLKAISPYIASLPPEEQHRLKSEIANRIFVPKGPNSNMKDSYPINTHELLIKILEKMEFKPSTKTEAQ